MKNKNLINEIIEAQNSYEKEKEKYKEFIDNYKSEQGDYLVYLYFTSNDPKEFDMEYYAEVYYFIYTLLITEKNFNENEAEKLAEKLSEQLDYADIKSVEDLKDENIKKFVFDKLENENN